MDFKDQIVEAALNLGFQRAVVASLTPLVPERQHFEDWLGRDYAGGMDYLKRDPHFRTSPKLLSPPSLSAIIVSASYYTEVPPSPGPNYGRVAAYAVGRDYHIVLREKLSDLKSVIEKICGRPLTSRSYSDDVPLYEQGLAARHGVGFAGKNTLIIGPKLMGSYHFVAELFTDIELAPDEPYIGTCGKCFRCGIACPTDAILPPPDPNSSNQDNGNAKTMLDARACISYLTIENKGGIPLALRQKMGAWVFGCDICQEVCPYNQRPPVTTWPEFQPQAGVGHHLELVGLLSISDKEFRARFADTPLLRPKRRGLLRNALVVIGNQRPDAIGELTTFAESEADPMLREHAAWALSMYKDKRSNAVLERLIKNESDKDTLKQMIGHLESACML
jgi:epoxyqueuosine reductase